MKSRNGRFPDRAPESLHGGMSPGREWSNAHQEHQRREDGSCGAFIEWRADGHFLAGDKFGDEREDHTPEANDEHAHEEQIVQKEQCLAREHGFHLGFTAQFRPAPDDQGNRCDRRSRR